MDDLLDMIITDESPSQISDKIKELLFSKSSEKINSFRPEVSASLFGETEEEWLLINNNSFYIIMPYTRHDESNNPVNPQPGFTTVTVFNGNEGWSTISYRDYNLDYIRHDSNNNVVGVGTYQRHDISNNSTNFETYQRHDSNNDPITI